MAMVGSVQLWDDLEESGDGSDTFEEVPKVPWNSPSSVDQGNRKEKPYAGFTRPATKRPSYNEFEEDLGSGDIDDSEERPIVNKPNKMWPDDDSDEVNFETPRPNERVIGMTEACPVNWKCFNGGLCIMSITTLRPYCQCMDGFVGQHCEDNDLVIDGEVPLEPEEVGQPEHRRLTLHDILQHPASIAVIVGACVLMLAIIITLLVCCCLCIRKKDEGSYALDAAILGEKKIEYTKVQNQTSQEFYA